MRPARLALFSALLMSPMFATPALGFSDQPYTQDWLRTQSGFWGTGVDFDSEGNVYVTGASPDLPSNGFRHDIYTIKYAPDGTQVWLRAYNNADDTTNQNDDPNWLTVDALDHVIVVGSTHTNAAGNEAVLLKYDSNGTLLWERLFGGPGVTSDYGFFVAVDPAGNVYAAGRSFGDNWDFIIVKYDAAGNQQWQRTRGFGGPDQPAALAVDAQGRVLVTGENWNQRAVSVAYDTNGNELWSAVLDHPTLSYALGSGIFDGAGNALITGTKAGTVFLAKYDPAGQLLFERLYGGGTANRLRVDSNDNVIITGESAANDMHTIKIDPAGNELWTAFGGPAGEGVGIDLAVLANDDIVVAGTTGFVVWTLTSYAPDGTEQWALTTNPGGIITNYPHKLAVGPDESLALTGSSPIATAHFAPPRWIDLGHGLAGTNGVVPVLQGIGNLAGNDPFTLRLSDALQGSTAYFVLGLSTVYAPFKQGILVPSPGAILPGLPVDGAGNASIGSTWPAGLPAGFSLFSQCWVADGVAPAGFAASNGLRATKP